MTVTNWMSDFFLAYVIFLEAWCGLDYNKGIGNFEVDVKDHKWREVKSGRNVTSSWCFSTMVAAETICDVIKIVDIHGVRFGPRDNDVSVAY